ncbi:MlaA family lipoprotein [Pontibaca salina]|uniref:VacJ family lipoprotein n=1 Tax=Pontibaca salina TaxID=2795731 RepID=A0A934HU13_9RHOB|nr:VacJ family lipoprotein [Pontibaca salina]MBI6629574.1 VacJ family lipoprotein [Pontibaca salina]
MSLKSQYFRTFGVLFLVAFVSACSVPDSNYTNSGEVFDPHEQANRGVHRFNLAMDSALFRPASRGYTNVVPDPIEDSFNHFSQNLSKPKDMFNFLLQGRVKEAGISLARFVLNTTIGFAGLADPATEFGIPAPSTDFGETLYVWGLNEGAYIELPVFGPSTQRDAVGRVVDFFTNPLGFNHKIGGAYFPAYAYVVESLSDRGRFSSTVDSILYDSADSYSVARVIYLQNRRFKLEGAEGDTYVDPYDDPYADTGSIIDPYEDPYDD